MEINTSPKANPGNLKNWGIHAQWSTTELLKRMRKHSMN